MPAREYHPGSGHVSAHDDLAQRPATDPLISLGKRLSRIRDFRPSKRYETALETALVKAGEARAARFQAAQIDAINNPYSAAVREFEVNAAANGSVDQWQPYGSAVGHLPPPEQTITILKRKREAFEAAARVANYELLATVDEAWFESLVRYWNDHAVVTEIPGMTVQELRKLEAEAARIRPEVVNVMRITAKAKGATSQEIKKLKHAQEAKPDELANINEIKALVRGVEFRGALVDIADLKLIVEEETEAVEEVAV